MEPTIRAGWLDYSWRVVNSPCSHIEECRANNGSPDVGQRHAPQWMRWPGYVGARWRPERGLLFIGSVHREFDVGLSRAPEPELRALEDDLIAANRSWRESGRSAASDDAYLTGTQAAFAAMWRRWPRSRIFEPFVAGLGLDADEVAWTNLAKCQVFRFDRDTGRRLKDFQEDLQSICQPLYPVADTIALLRPRATFVAVLGAAKRASLPPDARLYVYHGLHGTRLGERPTSWTARELSSLLADEDVLGEPRPGDDHRSA